MSRDFLVGDRPCSGSHSADTNADRTVTRTEENGSPQFKRHDYTVVCIFLKVIIQFFSLHLFSLRVPPGIRLDNYVVPHHLGFSDNNWSSTPPVGQTRHARPLRYTSNKGKGNEGSFMRRYYVRLQTKKKTYTKKEKQRRSKYRTKITRDES